MSILEAIRDFSAPDYADVTTRFTPESAYEDSTYMERQLESASQVVNRGMETALRLQKLVNVRGRTSANASACRTMLDDYFIGLDDLRSVLKAAQAGDRTASSRIPGILAAIQESLNFETALSSMKGYKKGSETALPAYVQEVMTGLSSSFDGLCEAVRPLSDVVEVQMQVRNRVNAVGNYKFHGAAAIKAPAVTPHTLASVEPDPALMVNLDVSNEAPSLKAMEPVGADFDPTESAWFDGETAPAVETPAKIRGGIFSKIMGVLGGLASSFKRNLPRAAMAGALLAAACGEAVPPETTTPPIPRIPTTVPAAPVAVAEDWKITDTRDVTHAIRSALHDKCPSLTKAELIKTEGPLVHAALVAETEGLTDVIKGQETRDTSGEWLGKVSADEVQYGNTIPSDYPGVLASRQSTRIAGAHGLDSDTVVAYAMSGLPAFDSYTCPTY